MYTVSPENITTLSHRNSDTHESLLTIFGTFTEKAGNQKVPYFPSEVSRV